MKTTPVQPTVLELVRKYTKQPVKMGSKLQDLCIFPLDRAFLVGDLEDTFGIAIDNTDGQEWKKVKNIVATVNLMIHRQG